MSVSVKKLWGVGKFNSLSKEAKYLYIYLIANPNINTVGVCVYDDLTTIIRDTGLELDEIRKGSKELISAQLIHIKKVEKYYFIMPRHFSSIPKSETTILKFQRDLGDLPDEIQEYVDKIGIKIRAKIKEFEKPTVEEIKDFLMEQGHIIDPHKVINFYEAKALEYGRTDIWVNSRGKPVKNWKATLMKNWFKPDNKLKKNDDAPEGYKYLYVVVDGKLYQPESWRDGKPVYRDFLVQRKLNKEYERLKGKRD